MKCAVPRCPGTARQSSYYELPYPICEACTNRLSERELTFLTAIRYVKCAKVAPERLAETLLDTLAVERDFERAEAHQ